MRTVNGCILLLAAISITFAAVSGAYHLDMQQLLALILRQENVPVQGTNCLLANPRAAYSCCAVSGRGVGRGRNQFIRECSVIP